MFKHENMKNWFLFCLLLSCLSATAQERIDSTIAYVRYNPEIKKYAVWARSHYDGYYSDSARWDYLNWSEMRGLYLRLAGQPKAAFLLFDKKEDAEAVAKQYIPVWLERMGYVKKRPDDFEKAAKGFQ